MTNEDVIMELAKTAASLSEAVGSLREQLHHARQQCAPATGRSPETGYPKWMHELLKREEKLPTPNPALENVLAKLRDVAASYPESNDNCTMCREITLGDLRRWIESEGK